MKRNEVVIDGRLLKRATLRHTPAGIPVIDFIIGHKSIQQEAGRQREARCEVEAVAIGELAVRLSTQKLNQPLQMNGFLTHHSVRDRRLVLHVVRADVISGTINNGTE